MAKAEPREIPETNAKMTGMLSHHKLGARVAGSADAQASRPKITNATARRVRHTRLDTDGRRLARESSRRDRRVRVVPTRRI